jgi:hypothetical protein
VCVFGACDESRRNEEESNREVKESPAHARKKRARKKNIGMNAYDFVDDILGTSPSPISSKHTKNAAKPVTKVSQKRVEEVAANEDHVGLSTKRKGAVPRFRLVDSDDSKFEVYCVCIALRCVLLCLLWVRGKFA